MLCQRNSHWQYTTYFISTAYFINTSHQSVGKNVTAETNTRATIEELLDASFYMLSVSYQRKSGRSFLPRTQWPLRFWTCSHLPGYLLAREMLGISRILLSAGPLARSQCVSGRSCYRPSRHRFSWFSSVFKQMLRLFPSSKLLLRASHATLPT
jgi:hypothetical protein